MLKKILIAIVAIVIIGGVISAMGGVKETATPTSNQSASKPSDTKPPAEVIKVTAVDLAAAYESNEVKADQTYKGKTAEITGTVQDVGVILDQTYITLSSGKDFAIVSTQCFFEDKAEIAKVAELKKEFARLMERHKAVPDHMPIDKGIVNVLPKF
jgi:hypothetical protein